MLVEIKEPDLMSLLVGAGALVYDQEVWWTADRTAVVAQFNKKESKIVASESMLIASCIAAVEANGWHASYSEDEWSIFDGKCTGKSSSIVRAVYTLLSAN